MAILMFLLVLLVSLALGRAVSQPKDAEKVTSSPETMCVEALRLSLGVRTSVRLIKPYLC